MACVHLAFVLLHDYMRLLQVVDSTYGGFSDRECGVCGVAIE